MHASHASSSRFSLHPDYTVRTEPAAILAALAGLNLDPYRRR